MRITKLKNISIVGIICALIMIFAHIVIPHIHSDVHSHNHSCDHSLCQSHITQSPIEDGHAHKCMIADVVYHPDSSKDTDYILAILDVEDFGYTYNPDYAEEEIIEKFFPLTIPLNILIVSKDLPFRAPPFIC